MSTVDYIHKVLQRWDSRRKRFIYNSTRGTIEPFEGEPAGHSGKQTASLNADPLIAPAVLNLPANTRGYITMAQFNWIPAGANEKVSLQDAAGNNILSATEAAGNEHNETEGDGSGVIAWWDGVLTAVQTHGGAPAGGIPIIVSYYVRPIV